MKRILLITITAIITQISIAQKGESVQDIHILTLQGDTISLPYFKEKNLLLFYADPSKPNENLGVRTYFQEHPVNSSHIASYGIINMAAAPAIPKSIIIRRAQKAVAGTQSKVYVDPKSYLPTEWHINGAMRNGAIIAVSKEGIIDFCKIGQLDSADRSNMLSVIYRYNHEE